VLGFSTFFAAQPHWSFAMRFINFTDLSADDRQTVAELNEIDGIDIDLDEAEQISRDEYASAWDAYMQSAQAA